MFEPTDPDLSEKKRRSLEIKPVVEVPVRVSEQAGGMSSPGLANLAKKQREEVRVDRGVDGACDDGACDDGVCGDGVCGEQRDKECKGTGFGTESASPDESPAQPPSQFVCPITMEVMLDAVILAPGDTYDRPSITAWLKTRKRSLVSTLEAHPTARSNFSVG